MGHGDRKVSAVGVVDPADRLVVRVLAGVGDGGDAPARQICGHQATLSDAGPVRDLADRRTRHEGITDAYARREVEPPCGLHLHPRLDVGIGDIRDGTQQSVEDPGQDRRPETDRQEPTGARDLDPGAQSAGVLVELDSDLVAGDTDHLAEQRLIPDGDRLAQTKGSVGACPQDGAADPGGFRGAHVWTPASVGCRANTANRRASKRRRSRSRPSRLASRTAPCASMTRPADTAPSARKCGA